MFLGTVKIGHAVRDMQTKHTFTQQIYFVFTTKITSVYKIEFV